MQFNLDQATTTEIQLFTPAMKGSQEPVVLSDPFRFTVDLMASGMVLIHAQVGQVIQRIQFKIKHKMSFSS